MMKPLLFLEVRVSSVGVPRAQFDIAALAAAQLLELFTFTAAPGELRVVLVAQQEEGAPDLLWGRARALQIVLRCLNARSFGFRGAVSWEELCRNGT